MKLDSYDATFKWRVVNKVLKSRFFEKEKALLYPYNFPKS